MSRYERLLCHLLARRLSERERTALRNGVENQPGPRGEDPWDKVPRLRALRPFVFLDRDGRMESVEGEWTVAYLLRRWRRALLVAAAVAAVAWGLDARQEPAPTVPLEVELEAQLRAVERVRAAGCTCPRPLMDARGRARCERCGAQGE